MDLGDVLGCLFDGSAVFEIFGQLSTFVNFTTMLIILFYKHRYVRRKKLE